MLLCTSDFWVLTSDTVAYGAVPFGPDLMAGFGIDLRSGILRPIYMFQVHALGASQTVQGQFIKVGVSLG